MFATDTDKLVSIKGLVIRATPVIPDMKLGKLEAAIETLNGFSWAKTLHLSGSLLPMHGLSAHPTGRD